MTKEEEWLLKNPYGLILDVNENGEIIGVKIDPEVPAEDRFAYIMDRHTSGESRENWEKIKAEIQAKKKGEVANAAEYH